ncbi:MAG UNVERIFIED_CONTAM: hypothetical protein LVR18_12770 [Planctomycetaceae bacterium]|jgi:hypothetical protein
MSSANADKLQERGCLHGRGASLQPSPANWNWYSRERAFQQLCASEIVNGILHWISADDIPDGGERQLVSMAGGTHRAGSKRATVWLV